MSNLTDILQLEYKPVRTQYSAIHRRLSTALREKGITIQKKGTKSDICFYIATTTCLIVIEDVVNYKIAIQNLIKLKNHQKLFFHKLVVCAFNSMGLEDTDVEQNASICNNNKILLLRWTEETPFTNTLVSLGLIVSSN